MSDNKRTVHADDGGSIFDTGNQFVRSVEIFVNCHPYSGSSCSAAARRNLPNAGKSTTVTMQFKAPVNRSNNVMYIRAIDSQQYIGPVTARKFVSWITKANTGIVQNSRERDQTHSRDYLVYQDNERPKATSDVMPLYRGLAGTHIYIHNILFWPQVYTSIFEHLIIMQAFFLQLHLLRRVIQRSNLSFPKFTMMA